MLILHTAIEDLPAATALVLFLSMIAVWSAIACGA